MVVFGQIINTVLISNIAGRCHPKNSLITFLNLRFDSSLAFLSEYFLVIIRID